MPTLVEERHHHVEVAAGSCGARDLPQDLQGTPDATAFRPLGEKWQSDPEPPAPDAKLVEGLLMPGEGLGEVSEDSAHTIPQKRARGVNGLQRVGCHGGASGEIQA